METDRRGGGCDRTHGISGARCKYDGWAHCLDGIRTRPAHGGACLHPGEQAHAWHSNLRYRLGAGSKRKRLMDVAYRTSACEGPDSRARRGERLVLPEKRPEYDMVREFTEHSGKNNARARTRRDPRRALAPWRR